MSIPANLKFLDCRTIRESDSLEGILGQGSGRAHNPRLIEVGSLAFERFAFWRYYDDKAKGELGIAYDKRQLTFRTTDSKSYTTLTFDIGWSLDDAGVPTRATLQATAFQTTMFTQREHDPELHAQRFVDIGVQLYQLVHPTFGWMERCRPSGYTKWSHIDNLEIPHIYWANFFAPTYVNKYSREYFLSAPGWRKESLSDGGLLYVLSADLAGTGAESLIEQVKHYFGTESVRRGMVNPKN